jgi:putative flippase GtrA
MTGRMLRNVGPLLRFVAVGLGNTVFSLLVFIVLRSFLPVLVSYACAYTAGLSLSAFLTHRVVFRVASGSVSMLITFGLYTGVLILGLALVQVLRHGLALPPLAAATGSIAVTAPANYLCGQSMARREQARLRLL